MIMEIRRVGNSREIIIPKALPKEAGLEIVAEIALKRLLGNNSSIYRPCGTIS